MPQGVTYNFLTILDRELRVHGVLLAVALPLMGLVGFLAELADAPPWGPLVMRTTVLLVVAFLVGLAVSWWLTQRTQESIRERWRKWMQWSQTSQRLPDVETRVEDRRRWFAPAVQGVAWAVAIVLNVLVFVALWYGWGGARGFAELVLLLDAVALGALAAYAVWRLQWTWRFRSALREMVEDGTVGVWGEL